MHYKRYLTTILRSYSAQKIACFTYLCISIKNWTQRQLPFCVQVNSPRPIENKTQRPQIPSNITMANLPPPPPKYHNSHPALLISASILGHYWYRLILSFTTPSSNPLCACVSKVCAGIKNGSNSRSTRSVPSPASNFPSKSTERSIWSCSQNHVSFKPIQRCGSFGVVPSVVNDAKASARLHPALAPC